MDDQSLADMNHQDTTSELSAASHWILAQYIKLTEDLEKYIDSYELAHAVDALYTFLWDNYADWYVEYLKTDTAQIPFAKKLYREFIITASPFMPFEAEVLWKEYFGESELLAHYLHSPEFMEQYKPLIDQQKVDEFATIIQFITSLRSTRGLFAIDPVTAIIIHSDSQILHKYSEFIAKAARATITNPDPTSLYSVSTGGIEYKLDIMSYINDKQKEIDRTTKLIDSLNKQKEALEKQLGNEQFLANAEVEVVEEKRLNLEQRTNEIAQQQTKLEFLRR